MVRVYKVPVLKSVMDVLMALSKAFPMNLVLLIFYLIWTTQFSSIAAFFHSQKTIKDVSLMYVAIAAPAVSYTHLDVYKRQEYNRASEAVAYSTRLQAAGGSEGFVRGRRTAPGSGFCHNSLLRLSHRKL